MYAHRIHHDLLWDGYLVWIDLQLEEGEKWNTADRPQPKSVQEIYLPISPEAIILKAVHHEISMACGCIPDIVPVKIKEYKPRELPIGVEEIQLFNMVQDAVDYDRELPKG